MYNPFSGDFFAARVEASFAVSEYLIPFYALPKLLAQLLTFHICHIDNVLSSE